LDLTNSSKTRPWARGRVMGGRNEVEWFPRTTKRSFDGWAVKSPASDLRDLHATGYFIVSQFVRLAASDCPSEIQIGILPEARLKELYHKLAHFYYRPGRKK